MNFSASRIKLWMACSAAADMKYNQRLQPERHNAKAVFGSAIHAALELYNLTGDIDGALAMFKDLWGNPEKLGAPVDLLWWPKMTSYNGLRQRGVEVLRVFHEQCQWDKRVVIAAEHAFLVPFGRHTLNGKVDLLEVRRSGRGKDLLRVLDYKTASRRPNMAELALDVQFTCYMWAVAQREFWFGAELDGKPHPDYPPVDNAEWAWEMYGDLPRRAIWSHLWDAKEIDAGPRDDLDFRRLYRVCEEIEAAEAKNVHVPHIGDACLLCDFRDACALQITIPTAAELAEQDAAWI